MMWWSRLSLRHHVVLIIVGTVAAVIGIHDIAAYRELRRSAIDAAGERLRSASMQVGEQLDAQAAQVHDLIRGVARTPAVSAFLRGDTTAASRAAVFEALRPLIGPASTAGLAAAVWDARGTPALETRPPYSVSDSAQRDAIAALEGQRDAAVGPILVRGDSLICAAIARVTNGSATIGYVVQWRRLTASPRSREQLLDLIGPGARLVVGTTDGPGWTDLAGIVDRPSLQLPGREAAWYTDGGVRHLAVARPIAGTAWTLVASFTEASVLARVGPLVRRLALLTAILLLVGLGLAWLLGRRLTTPLADLATAATAISRGAYGQRVAVVGGQEVRALGTAFNTMAESVERAHQSLEERSEELAERAAQLSEQAAELEMTNDELTKAVDEAVRARDDLATSLAKTERLSAELDASLASAPVGFAFHDLDGRYRRVNDSLATLHGVPADAHIGRLPSDLVPAFGAAIEAAVQRALRPDAQPAGVELVGETPAHPGVEQHWLANFYPIRTAEGKTLGAGAVVTDLTSFRRLESQLVQSQKMEAVGRLAGGIAHDFNNVLTAISGFGQFALSELPEQSVEVRADIEQVLAAADRAASLTRQLLAFSRQQVLKPQVLDLNAVVDRLSRMLARLIGEDVRLVSRPAANLCAVKADPNQIEQVLVNLVVNARDAMPNGGTLVIETANVMLDAAYASTHDGVRPGRHVMLAVTDTGVGMDAELRERVFEPFFTTKPAGKGTGLGLATVYGIVKQSGGTIDLYSEPGRGTTFKVYFPECIERAEQRRTPTASAALVPGVRRTVLLVDDDPLVAATARRALERAGYQVLTASNGREALGVARSHDGALHVLVTDLVMPEMGGRELARQLLASMPALRVLYTSGYTAEAMNQQAVLEPNDAFLGKPFTPDALLQAVHAVAGARDAEIASG